MSKVNEVKVESCSRVKDGKGRLALERLRCEGFGKNILKIFIMKILRKKLESTCVAMMGFEGKTILEESQLEKPKLRRELRS